MRLAAVAGTLAALAGGVGGMGGCAFRSSASPDRTSLAAATTPHEQIRWPERYLDLATAIAGATDKLTTVGNIVRPEVGPVLVEHVTTAKVLSTRAYAQGVVRELEKCPEAGLMARLVPDAEFLSFRSPEQAAAVLSDQRMWRASFGPDGARFDRECTRLEFWRPVSSVEGAPAPAPRGLVVHLGSLGGRQYEMPVLEQFRRRGWAVVRLNASTAWESEKPVKVAGEADITPAAERLAGMIDERLAEIAYAAEGAVAWIEKAHPDVPTDRVIVIGFSAGALGAPATAVRLGDRVKAMVLVGAGADILDVSQTSSLTNGGIRVEWPDAKRDPALWDELKARYLERSVLDPYELGPRVAGTPTLMLHGWLDEIVPARTGDLMWERLGRPERWSFPLGHKGVFWRLPAYARDISVWGDEAAK